MKPGAAAQCTCCQHDMPHIGLHLVLARGAITSRTSAGQGTEQHCQAARADSSGMRRRPGAVQISDQLGEWSPAIAKGRRQPQGWM